MALNTRIIKDWSEFQILGPHWDGLLEQTDLNSVFLTWSWMDAWRQTTDQAPSPYIITVWSQEGELVGLLPLWVSPMQLMWVLPVRALRYLGDSCNAFEYPECIVKPAYEADVIQVISGALEAHSSEWDVIWLPNCSDQPSTWQRMSSLASEQTFVRTRPAYFSRLQLATSWEDYEKTIASNHRQKNRRLLRRFDTPDGKFEVCESANQCSEFLSALFALHNKRWNQAGLPGSFKNRTAVTRFYETLLANVWEKGWIFLTGYRLDGELKAVQFGLVFGQRYSQVQEGFDPDLEAGLGNALRYFSFRQCIERGIEVYDFLGGHTEHKRRWGGERFEGFDQLVLSKGSRLRSLLFRKVWPTGRWVQDRAKRFLDSAAEHP